MLFWEIDEGKIGNREGWENGKCPRRWNFPETASWSLMIRRAPMNGPNSGSSRLGELQKLTRRIDAAVGQKLFGHRLAGQEARPSP